MRVTLLLSLGLHFIHLSFPSLPVVVKDFQDYVEPEEGCQGSPQRRGPLTSGPDEENVALPLGDNVLTHNLGIPVLVVCTKVGLIRLAAFGQ